MGFGSGLSQGLMFLANQVADKRQQERALQNQIQMQQLRQQQRIEDENRQRQYKQEDFARLQEQEAENNLAQNQAILSFLGQQAPENITEEQLGLLTPRFLSSAIEAQQQQAQQQAQAQAEQDRLNQKRAWAVQQYNLSPDTPISYIDDLVKYGMKSDYADKEYGRKRGFVDYKTGKSKDLYSYKQANKSYAPKRGRKGSSNKGSQSAPRQDLSAMIQQALQPPQLGSGG